MVFLYGYLNIERKCADAGISQFTADQFHEHCHTSGICLVLAAPKKQNQNHLAKRTWQTVSAMGRSLLEHVWLPDTFMYHALVYETHIFNILPVRGLLDEQKVPSTPYQLFFGKKLSISNFVVFGCPTIVHHWVATGKTNGKQTERGMHGIYFGFVTNQKDSMVFTTALQKVLISDNVIFDESFSTAIATKWQQHQDSLALKPALSYIPDAATCIKQTGAVENLPTFIPPQVEEGTNPDKPAHNDNDNLPELSNDASDSDSASDDDGSVAMDNDDSLVPPSQLTTLQDIEPETETLIIIDDGTSLHCSTRAQKTNPKYAGMAHTVNWPYEDMKLAEACAVKVHPIVMPASTDVLSWESAPKTICDILKMPEGPMHTGWLNP